MARFQLLALGLLMLMSASPGADAQDWREFERLMLDQQFEAASAIAVAQAQESKNPVWMYNAAWALGQTGQENEAIDWLAKAAASGYSGVRSIETDSGLEPIRAHERFDEIHALVQANADTRFGQFQRQALATEPVVVVPPGFDAEQPHDLIIVLHGSGGVGRSMAAAWRAHAHEHDAILIAPDAMRLEGNGYSWVYRDEAEWYVMHLIEWARERWEVDRVVLTGYAQGATIAFEVGQTHASAFHAVIPIGGHYAADVGALPTEGERPRWYLLIGANDRPVPTHEQANATFRAAGMTVTRRVVPGLAHNFPPPEELKKALAWCLGEER